MQLQKFYIKGMVCERCIYSVRNELKILGVEVQEVNLGEVSLIPPAEVNHTLIEERLKPLGFSLLLDKKIKLVEDTKRLVEEVYSGDFDFPQRFRFSNLLAEKLNTNYDAISAAFTILEQTTIEKYIIDFRIQKIKELLVYTDRTLADIAFALGFSSVAHLSRQFKEHTGLNPSYFKEIKARKEAVKAADTGD